MQDNPWVTIVVAIIGSGVLTSLVTGIVQKISGSADRRRLRNREIADQATAQRAAIDLAEEREDYERRWRQEIESYAATCRIACITHGGTPPDPPDILKIIGPRP